MIRLVVEACRPKQWIKNALVLAAPLVSRTIFESAVLPKILLIFLSFCLVSSSMYLINDLRDRVADSVHRTKCSRPIASGRLSPVVAWRFAVGLAIVGLLVAASVSTVAFAVVAVYAVITSAYSLYLKRIPILELLIVSSGFVLRALAGAATADVPPSRWFIACILSGSLFVAIKKRYAELVDTPIGSASTRKVLKVYKASTLRIAARAGALFFVLTYAGWAVFVDESGVGGLALRLLSTVPLAGAAIRYEHSSSQSEGEAPEDLFGSDRVLQLLGLLWIVLVGASIYLAK